jgi:hypothetical protein
LELGFSQGNVTVISETFTDLGPMYHATFDNPQSPAQTFAMSRGQTQTFTATFKNLGTRTWYASTTNPNNTRIRLGIIDPLLATTNYSKEPFQYDSGDSLRPATLLESSVPPGSKGTFTFQLTVPKKTTPKTYTFRVAPVAENSSTGTNMWMNRGDSVIWFVTVK